jgi:hypothetical protein
MLEGAREAKDVLVALAVTLTFCSPIHVRVISLPRRFNKHIKVCVCVCVYANVWTDKPKPPSLEFSYSTWRRTAIAQNGRIRSLQSRDASYLPYSCVHNCAFRSKVGAECGPGFETGGARAGRTECSLVVHRVLATPGIQTRSLSITKQSSMLDEKPAVGWISAPRTEWEYTVTSSRPAP